MGGHRITRRQALAVGLAAAAGGTAGAAPVPKADPDASWVGKTVLPRAFATKGWVVVPDAPPGPDGRPAELPVVLDGASYEVKAEEGTRVEVFLGSGDPCRVEKADLLPLADAVGHFTTLLKADEKDTFALVSRGWAHHLLGKPDRAVADLTAFLALNPAAVPGPLPPAPKPTPQRWEGLVNRGLVYAEQGEFDKAMTDLNEAVAGWPGVGIAWVNRGYARESQGDYAGALADYFAAGKTVPMPALASNNQAWVYATCPDPKVRDGKKALQLAEPLCAPPRDREGAFLDTLAAAYAEAGRFDDAVKAQEKALADKGYAARYGEDGRKRLKLYQEKKPFRTEPVKK